MDQFLRHLSRRLVVRTLRLGKEENGAVMVEFVIVAPLFLFLVLGIIQVGGIAHADAVLQHANFMACRAGVVHHEAISKGWAKSGSTDINDIMKKAAERAFGPMHRTIPGYHGLAAGGALGLTRPLPSSPVVVISVTPSFEIVETGGEFMNEWMLAKTETRLGLPSVWVGKVLQNLQMGPNTFADTDGEFARHGMDAMANTIVDIPNDPLYQMPFIMLRSDAFMDSRQNRTENRWTTWPMELSGDATANSAHPTALPVQNRWRW